MRPSNHLSCAMNAFLILLLTESVVVLWIRQSWVSLYLLMKGLYESEQTTCWICVTDVLWTQSGFNDVCQLCKRNTNTATSCISTFQNFATAIIHLYSGCQFDVGEITLFTLWKNWVCQLQRNLIGLLPAAKKCNSESDYKSELKINVFPNHLLFPVLA